MAKNQKKMRRKLVKGMTILGAAVFLLLSDFSVSAAEYREEYDIPPGNDYSREAERKIPSVTEDPDYIGPMYGVMEPVYNPLKVGGGEGLPPLRNQNPHGTCWAFSVIGVAEANHYRKTGEMLDLSELHLAYFTYRSVLDPLGGLEGDKNELASYNNFLKSGGSQWEAANVLATWQGAAAEETAPYESAYDAAANGLDDATAYKDALHLQGAYRVNLRKDPELAKRLIKEKGGLAIIYYSMGRLDFYNWEYGSYYVSEDIPADHSVVAVGWDDNFPKEYFLKEPEGDGAWLVRNSWSKTDSEIYRHDGYFWLSYYDKSLLESSYAFDFEPADNYDNNYQYDGAMNDWHENIKSKEAKIANVFTVKASENQLEELKAASFVTGNTNVDYTIEVYTDLEDPANPESGILAEEATVSGRTEMMGYYTVPLKTGVKMKPGTDFSIVVTLSKQSENVNIVQECTQLSTMKSTASLKDGQSFVFVNEGNWQDCKKWNNYEFQGNLRIKAFTNLCDETVQTATDIKLDVNELHLEKGDTRQLSATIYPADAVNKVKWTSSEDTIVSVDGKGNVTALQPGTAVITATAGRVSAQCSVTVKGKEPTEPEEPSEPEEPTSIELNYKEAELKLGESLKLSATLQPAGIEHQIEWSSSDSAIASVDAEGSVRTHESGKAVITAGAGDKTAVCTVNVSFPFSDVPIVKGNWKYESVCYVYANGIMQGIAGTDWFKPDEPLTRAMFATVLYRMAGSEPVEYDDKFPDVVPDKWYSDAVIWANKEGIVSGLGDGNYGINVNITREQIAKMLYKYAEGKGFDVSTRASLDTYTDSEQVSGWAEEYMKWAAGVGMISGKPNGDGSYRLDPKGEATRAECAAMLKRFQGKYN